MYKNLLCNLVPSTTNTSENIIRHEKPPGKYWKMTLQEGCGCWLRKKNETEKIRRIRKTKGEREAVSRGDLRGHRKELREKEGKKTREL